MQKNYKWCVIAMLWFVCVLNYADRQAVFVLFPLLRVQFHLSDMQLVLLGSSFMWMYAVFGPVAGWLGDRLSRRGLILGGLFLWLCVTAATILSRSYWQLAALRALGGIAPLGYRRRFGALRNGGLSERNIACLRDGRWYSAMECAHCYKNAPRANGLAALMHLRKSR